MTKFTKAQTDSIVKVVQEYYYSETPQPKFVNVDPKSLRTDKADPSYTCAKVTLEVDTAAGVKAHIVNIRFRTDGRRRLVGSSISHL